ncbi:universal stress protein [Streptomyces sp. NPDC058001]|uniref:universal stress protein n=1 Tax=Streptomyces sp. NPDC058001 TaxID=3346300 RepID=UPI0036EED73F
MDKPLVVGVDGSESSIRAADWAVEEAARRGLRLRLIFASLWERYDGIALAGGLGRPPEEIAAQHVVASAAERATRRHPEVRVSTEVVPHDAAETLITESGTAFAVVTGARGRGGIAGLLLGSVSLTVAAHARCPVVVVRGDKAGLAGTHGKILLGVGDAPVGSEAVRFAFEEAAVRRSTLSAVRTWRVPSHEDTDHPMMAGEPARFHKEQASLLLEKALEGDAADHPEIRLEQVTPEGPATKVLVHRSAAADLVIVGARRREGHFGLQLGRISHALLHHAQCPVVVVPHST